jgi:hypothetical protein
VFAALAQHPNKAITAPTNAVGHLEYLESQPIPCITEVLRLSGKSDTRIGFKRQGNWTPFLQRAHAQNAMRGQKTSLLAVVKTLITHSSAFPTHT